MTWLHLDKKWPLGKPQVVRCHIKTCVIQQHTDSSLWAVILSDVCYSGRGTGRWLTDVSPLLPLLDGNKCTLTMKTVPWAMPWVVSLNLRFSIGNQTGINSEAIMMFEGVLTRWCSGVTWKYHIFKLWDVADEGGRVGDEAWRQRHEAKMLL